MAPVMAHLPFRLVPYPATGRRRLVLQPASVPKERYREDAHKYVTGAFLLAASEIYWLEYAHH